MEANGRCCSETNFKTASSRQNRISLCRKKMAVAEASIQRPALESAPAPGGCQVACAAGARMAARGSAARPQAAGMRTAMRGGSLPARRPAENIDAQDRRPLGLQAQASPRLISRGKSREIVVQHEFISVCLN